MLDEPLAALGVRESAHVLGLIQNLRRQRNVSIILIVHNYNQIFEVCDRINFLHSGEIVLDASTSETSEEELIRIVKSGLGRQAIAAAAAEVEFRHRRSERLTPFDTIEREEPSEKLQCSQDAICVRWRTV